MKTFADILHQAEVRKGGSEALKKLLPPVLSEKKLAKKSDDRFLAMMAKTINQAGFSWSVIEKKWPQFEEAFFGFDIDKLSRLSPEQWEAYTKDTRVVRNWQKIKAVMDNVAFIQREIAEHGSFGVFIAQWPLNDQVGLMYYLKKNGSRLGGQSNQLFMRYVGKDCFMLTKDVVAAIKSTGVEMADNPSSQRDLRRAQDIMNQWHDESGLPYTHISKIAAFSNGENREERSKAS